MNELAPVPSPEKHEFWVPCASMSGRQLPFGGNAPQGFTIKNWKGGLPFAHPKDGEQVLLNYLYRYWVDDLSFGFKWFLVGPSNNLERTITGRMFGMRFNGRTLTDKRPGYDEANADFDL